MLAYKSLNQGGQVIPISQCLNFFCIEINVKHSSHMLCTSANLQSLCLALDDNV